MKIKKKHIEYEPDFLLKEMNMWALCWTSLIILTDNVKYAWPSLVKIDLVW